MPNIDDTFNYPLDQRILDIKGFTDLKDYLTEQHRLMKKMYEEIAVGVNNTYEMTIISTSKTGVTSPPGVKLQMLPKLGMFYIMVSGLEDNMPQQCSIIQKPIVGTEATFTSLSTFTPSSGTWDTVSIVLAALNDDIGIGHDGGASLEGQFNVTIFGPYLPEGGG